MTKKIKKAPSTKKKTINNIEKIDINNILVSKKSFLVSKCLS